MYGLSGGCGGGIHRSALPLSLLCSILFLSSLSHAFSFAWRVVSYTVNLSQGGELGRKQLGLLHTFLTRKVLDGPE